MKILIAIFLIALSWAALLANEDVPQQGCSLEPLNDPVFDYLHVIVDSMKFNNWLIANYSSLYGEKIKTHVSIFTI